MKNRLINWLKSNKVFYSLFLLIKYEVFKKRNLKKRRGNIIMLHQGRCGSTVLADLLNQHSQIHWDGELYGDSDKLLKIITSNPIKHLKLKMAQFGNAFYGFEIKAMEKQHLSRYIKMPLDEFMGNLKKEDIDIFLILKRKNHLRQHLSTLQYKYHNISHTKFKRNTPNKITVDVRNCIISNHSAPMVENFRIVDKYYQTLNETLIGKKTLHLVYEEDILPDPLIAYRKICHFLGI